MNQTLGSVSAAEPYICEKPFETVPRYTGTRVSAIQVTGPSSSVLASSPVYESGTSGAQITYPLTETATATPLTSPQGVAISGFNSTVYVADYGSGKVYSAGGLTGCHFDAVTDGEHYPRSSERRGAEWGRRFVCGRFRPQPGHHGSSNRRPDYHRKGSFGGKHRDPATAPHFFGGRLPGQLIYRRRRRGRGCGDEQ